MWDFNSIMYVYMTHLKYKKQRNKVNNMKKKAKEKILKVT